MIGYLAFHCEELDEWLHEKPRWLQRFIPFRATICIVADESYDVPYLPEEDGWFARWIVGRIRAVE